MFPRDWCRSFGRSSNGTDAGTQHYVKKRVRQEKNSGKYFKASIHLKIFTSVIIHVMNYWGISRYPPCSSSRGNRFSKLSQNRFILHTCTTLLFQCQCNVCTCLAIPSPILHYLFQSLIKNLGLTELQNHIAFDHYHSHKSHSSPDGSSWTTVTVCWTVGGYIDAHLNFPS